MEKYLLILFSKSHHHTVCGCLSLIKLTCVIVSGGKGEKKLTAGKETNVSIFSSGWSP